MHSCYWSKITIWIYIARWIYSVYSFLFAVGNLANSIPDATIYSHRPGRKSGNENLVRSIGLLFILVAITGQLLSIGCHLEWQNKDLGRSYGSFLSLEYTVYYLESSVWLWDCTLVVLTLATPTHALVPHPTGPVFALQSEPLPDTQHHVWMGSGEWFELDFLN